MNTGDDYTTLSLSIKSGESVSIGDVLVSFVREKGTRTILIAISARRSVRIERKGRIGDNRELSMRVLPGPRVEPVRSGGVDILRETDKRSDIEGNK